MSNLTITPSNPPELSSTTGYSQIVEVRAERLIFIAGQTAMDASGDIVGSGDFAAQVRQVFVNLEAALRSRGCSASNLVKLTVYLRNMSDLAIYRAARDRYFKSATPTAAPAITLVEVSRLYHP